MIPYSVFFFSSSTVNIPNAKFERYILGTPEDIVQVDELHFILTAADWPHSTHLHSSLKPGALGAARLRMPIWCLLHPRRVLHVRRSSCLARIKRPTVRSKRAWESHAADEGAATTPGTPCPAGSPSNREMIHVEADVREEDADCRTEEDVESVVFVVEPARSGNKGCCCGWEESKYHEICRRRSTTSSHRRLVIRKALVFNRVLRQIGESD